MNNDLTGKTSGTGLSGGREVGRFTQDLVNRITPEERQQLSLKASQIQLEQDKSDNDALRRFNASTAEMQRDVQTARDLNRSGPDFSLESTYNTASGETRIKVSKSNNMVWIVVAITVAVIFLALFAR